jgi:hypothetical protein
MAQTSFALMTNVGRAKEAAALANATSIEVTHIAIGDGSTVPSGGETQLYHEVARKTISGHGTVSGAANVAYFDCYLAAGDGPYTIREAGLYDVEGDLIAIAHYDPPINKPVPESGQTVEGTVRLEVAFSDVANVTIVVDPTMQVALQRLTRLPWIPVLSMSLATPPASPAVGDTYLIASSPTGAWAGNAGKIAEYTVAGWAMMTPPDGHGVSLPDGRVFERIGGSYIQKIALDVQCGKWTYGADGGAADAIVVTLSPAPSSLVEGLALRIKAANTNTGATTLTVNGLGAKPVVRRDGSALIPGDIVAGAVQDYVYDGANFQMPGAAAIGRLVLSANTTLYVNASTGSDTLYDGSAATVSGSRGPFKTIGKAVASAFVYGPSNYALTIQIADGTYNESVSIPSIGGPALVLNGNSGTPSNVLITSAAGSCISVRGPNAVTVSNLKVVCSDASSAGMSVNGSGASLETSNTVSGTCAGYVFLANGGGSALVGDHTFAGNCTYGFATSRNGALSLNGGSVYTISTSITVNAFATGESGGSMEVPLVSVPTFVNPGNVTGKKYALVLNAVLNTRGQGASYFPGTVAGTTATGGQYG